MEETSYHVIDFVGLYPVWSIVEFSMSPMGNTKDERTSLFTMCITALLGEMLTLITKQSLHPLQSQPMIEQATSQTRLISQQTSLNLESIL
jgi:hypothetical protein